MISFENMGPIQTEVENALCLGKIPAQNYIPEVFDNFTLSSSETRNFDRSCIIRPKFTGKTFQNGTPNSNSPIPIRGILNPWFAVYTGDLMQVTADTDPMMKLSDDVSDRIVIRGGCWGIERQCKPIILTEDSDNVYVQADRLDITPLPLPPKDNGYVISTHSGSTGTWNVKGGGQGVCSFDLIFPTQDAWKSYAKSQREAGTPITIWYQLDTPIFEPILTWNEYGKINPIDVTTTVTRSDTNAPISPNNIATIIGTVVSSIGYRGKVSQIMTESFEGDVFNGECLSCTNSRYECTGNELWAHSGNLVGVYNSNEPGVVGSMAVCSHSTYSEIILLRPEDNIPIKTTGFNTILNDEITAQRYPSYAKEQISAGTPITMIYQITTPIVNRYNIDISLTPGEWTIEYGDDNNLLKEINIVSLPDPNTYGNRIYPYTHTKVGTDHQLVGVSEAKEISFKATHTNQDGDTWTINGTPVAVTYADGQALLPTAILANENVRAVLERDVVKHIDGRIMPGENLLKNGDFRDRDNVLDHWSTVTTATLTPYHGYVILSDTNTKNDPSMTQLIDHLPFKKGDRLTLSILCECVGDSPYGTTGNIWTGQSWGTINWGNANVDTYYPEIGRMQTFTTTCILEHDIIQGAYFSIGTRGTTMKIYALKLEIGSRFTGWDEPLFDVLRLLANKPMPQKNLLDNGDFYKPINQLGQTVYSAPGYTIDRWMNSNVTSKVSLEPDGLKAYATAEWAGIIQRIDVPVVKSMIGKQLTATFDVLEAVSDHVAGMYTIYIAMFDANKKDLAGPFKHCRTIGTVTLTSDKIPENVALIEILIRSRPAYDGKENYIRVRRAKLESGPRFTGWDESKFSETLAECQQYQYSLVSNDGGGIRDISTSGIAYGITEAIFAIPIPEMRDTPSLRISDISKLRVFGMFSGVYRDDITPTQVIAHNASNKNFTLRVLVDSSTPYTIGNTYGLYSVDGTVSIMLDANI